MEFCQRWYDMRGNLRIVESKKIMKGRTKSPDLADAVVVLAELFRRKGMIQGDQKVAEANKMIGANWPNG